jgi:hypothetical protein
MIEAWTRFSVALKLHHSKSNVVLDLPLVYSNRSKIRNIYCPVQVSITRPRAMTTKKRLAIPIRLTKFRMNVQAVGAYSRGICRINQHQLHTKLNALINPAIKEFTR